MAACLAIKEDRKTLESMVGETQKRKEELSESELDIKTKIVSYIVTGTDAYFEVSNIACKIAGGILAVLSPEPASKLAGAILASPLPNILLKIQNNLIKGIEKAGAAIIGVNKDDVFIYDFEKNQRVPAFDDNKNRTHVIKGITGEGADNIMKDVVQPIIETIPEIVKEGTER